MWPTQVLTLTRIALLLGVILNAGCAHVVVPEVAEPAAETQPSEKNPVIIAMPPVPSRDSEVIIHEYGHEIRTPNLWLGGLFVILLSLAK